MSHQIVMHGSHGLVTLDGANVTSKSDKPISRNAILQVASLTYAVIENSVDIVSGKTVLATVKRSVEPDKPGYAITHDGKTTVKPFSSTKKGDGLDYRVSEQQAISEALAIALPSIYKTSNGRSKGLTGATRDAVLNMRKHGMSDDEIHVALSRSLASVQLTK